MEWAQREKPIDYDVRQTYVSHNSSDRILSLGLPECGPVEQREGAIATVDTCVYQLVLYHITAFNNNRKRTWYIIRYRMER